MSKVIGIPGWNLGDNSYGVTKPYLEFFKNYGTVIILSPDSFIESLDLLVLPGGKDIVASSDTFSFWNGAPDQFLEFFDAKTLPKYFDSNVPIFGICRGMQSLMRHTNVPLVQDIWWDHGYSKDESDVSKNKLTYSEEFRGLSHLANQIGSWHHQCVLRQDLKDTAWKTIAYTHDRYMKQEFQVVEYVMHRDKKIVATQSHPERNFNALEDYFLKKLLGLK